MRGVMRCVMRSVMRNVMRKSRLLLSVCVLAAAWCTQASAAEDSRLASTIKRLVTGHKGQVSVVIKHVDSGRGFAFEAERPMPTASLIKLAVMVEVYRQVEEDKVELRDRLKLTSDDTVPGSGLLRKYFTTGSRLSLRDAVRLMIAVSDNTATNLVLDHIGLKSTNRTMARLGHPNTRIHAKVFRRDTSIAERARLRTNDACGPPPEVCTARLRTTSRPARPRASTAGPGLSFSCAGSLITGTDRPAPRNANGS